MITVAGIDPGLVHTGVVEMEFDRDNRTVTVDSFAVTGPDPVAVKTEVDTGCGGLHRRLPCPVQLQHGPAHGVRCH